MQVVGDLGVADANLQADVRTEELLAAPSLGDEKASADLEGSLDHTDRRRSTDASLIQLSGGRFKCFLAASQNHCDLFFPISYRVL
jgi:hypothetical protein